MPPQHAAPPRVTRTGWITILLGVLIVLMRADRRLGCFTREDSRRGTCPDDHVGYLSPRLHQHDDARHDGGYLGTDHRRGSRASGDAARSDDDARSDANADRGPNHNGSTANNNHGSAALLSRPGGELLPGR